MNPSDGAPKANQCPRCSTQFICGSAAGMKRCWCEELPAISPTTKEDCLCKNCLQKEIEKRVGLCASCKHSKLLRSKSGAPIYLCELSLKNKSFLKYPRLPMSSCSGYTAILRD